MPEVNSTPYKDEASSLMNQASEKVSEVSGTVRDRASELGRKVVDKVNESRGSAASGLESTASTIHERANNLPGGEGVQNIAHATADKLAATANYMRTHQVQDVVTDVEQIVRRNPGQALLAAAVVGFCVGRMFSND